MGDGLDLQSPLYHVASGGIPFPNALCRVDAAVVELQAPIQPIVRGMGDSLGLHDGAVASIVGTPWSRGRPLRTLGGGFHGIGVAHGDIVADESRP